VGNPLYSLATFLYNRLFKTIPKADSYIKNSFNLVDKLRMLHTTGAHDLISLDMTSLFTNVPMDIGVNEQWNFILKDYSLPKNEFLGVIRFVLDSTFFLLIIYKLWHPHGFSIITGKCGLSNEEIRDGVLDVVEFGHFILL